MMRAPVVAIAAFVLAACASVGTAPPRLAGGHPEPQPHALETSVRVVEQGTCDVPGRPELSGEARVRLVYVDWPSYFEELCSSDLARHLRTKGRAVVPVTVSITPRGHALCAIDGVAARRLERGCSFEGVLSGGFAAYGYETSGDAPLEDDAHPPWERPRR